MPEIYQIHAVVSQPGNGDDLEQVTVGYYTLEEG
jgi:hypothetical protein